MSDFLDKVALITGGSRGIGRACAARLAQQGARVALCARNADAARQTAEALGQNVRGYGCDITDPRAVDDLVKQINEEWGPIHILVNNAGITRDGLIMRMKDADWTAVLETNLNGAFYACRAVARGMLKLRYGRIINISSIVGLHGQAGQTNYSAAKAALIGFTKAYAQEVGSRNITVNAVAPGYIPTEMTADISEETVRVILERTPLQRAGAPEDVAQAVAFLASDAAAFITGTVLCVDGGLGM